LKAGGDADFVGAGNTALNSWPALAHASANTAGSLRRESTPFGIDCHNRQDGSGFLAFAPGVPAVPSAQGGRCPAALSSFVWPRFDALSSSFAMGDELAHGVRM
jgi:hypothetical protein